MSQNKLTLFFLLFFSLNLFSQQNSGAVDRKVWIKAMTRIADPVLNNLSNNTLRIAMPVEVREDAKGRGREKVTHLEAFGRLLCGISPWLELGVDKTNEGKLRKHYIDLTIKCLQNCVDPESPDRMNFTTASRW